MVKRGQMQISFGVIFSIIIIIFTIAIAFYVISYFLKLQRCTNLELFYKDLETKVDKAWYGTESRETYKAAIPSGVDYICFGNLSQPPESSYTNQYDILKTYRNFPANVFVYPIQGSCGNTPSFYKLKNAESDKFFCAPVSNGKISIVIQKNIGDALVHITK
jgi:type II secretory pathway pseudopilin PulG